MISIKQDSELMTNYIPANPVTAGERFVGFYDESSRPACFSLSSDKKFNLVIQNEGAATLVDFGVQNGFDSNFQAFHVQQGADKKLDICAAYDDDNGTSGFFILHQIYPHDLLEPIANDQFIRGSGLPTIHHLFMSDFSNTGSKSAPLVFAAFQPPERITNTQDLGFIDVNGSSATLDRSWSLATNTDKILDVAFGTCDLGDGVFVLYEVAGKTKLQFKIIRGDDFVVEPRIPDGTFIATFIDPKYKETILITGGQTLTSHFSDEFLSTKKDGAVMAASMNIKDIHVTQAGGELRVWYTTSALSVHYYTCSTSKLSQGSITNLLPPGRAGRISPLLVTDGSKKQTSSLLSVDRTGNLTLSQQDPNSLLWQRYPYYYASAVNVTEIKGYTLRMQAVAESAADHALIPYCWLRLSSSGNVRCLINGLESDLTRKSQWFRTDLDGSLHVMIPGSDVSCHTVHVDCFCGGNSDPTNASDVKVIDVPQLSPGAKLASKLSSIKTGADLFACRTQKGEPLLSDNISREDADKAAAAIAMLVNHVGKVDDNDAQLLAAHVTSMKMAQNRTSKLGTHQPLNLSIWDDIEDGWNDVKDAMDDAWSWVEGRANDVKDWANDLIGKYIQPYDFEDAMKKVVQLTIEIGGEVYKFVMKTVKTLMKGISWVLQKIGAALEKLIQFLGFLFQWDDILTMTDNVTTMLNAGLDYGEMKVAGLESQARMWIGNAKDHLKNALVDVRKNKQTELAQVSTSSFSSQDKDSTQYSVAFNWIAYQIQHGAVLTNAKITSPSGGADTTGTVIAEIWNDFTNEFKVAETFVQNAGQDFLNLLQTNSWEDVQTVLAKLTDDLIDLIMDTMSNAASVVLKIVRLGIASIKALGNYSIEVPIITELWKLATSGRDLTLFNFVGLIISLPSTVLMKAITGNKPPKLKGRLTGDTLGQWLEHGSVSSDSSLQGDIISVMTPTLMSTLFLGSRVTALGLLWDSISGGEGGGVSFAAMNKTTNAVGLSVSRLSLASPLNPTMKLIAPKGGAKGIGTMRLAANTPWKENIFDTISLVFETVGLGFSWPPFYKEKEYVEWKYVLRWSIWFLDLANDAAVIVTRAIGGVGDIWRGILTMFTTIPKFGMKLAVVINDYEVLSETTRALIFHLTEAILDLAADIGFVVAAMTDKIQQEVSYIGLGVFLGCAGTSFGLEILNYIIEHNSAEE
ncbi:hypothetical protein F5Y16DRAFT_422964 [Xylariaceae sp. FL0255]|nr:hypothetical protein F5Y16DRAFT_422964 [Xylariaceae sp. FL0255]